jgi:hypothetical protein
MRSEWEPAALEEYRQLCEYHRHDDRIKWTILGLGYTGSAALIGIGLGSASLASVRAVLALVFAALLLLGVTFIYFDIDRDTRRRLYRLHRLELDLGIVNHRLFDERPPWPRRAVFGVNLIVITIAALLLSLAAIWVFVAIQLVWLGTLRLPLY